MLNSFPATYFHLTHTFYFCVEVIAALVSGENAKDALVKTNAAAHCAALARSGKRCPGKVQNGSCGGECIVEATRVTKELTRTRSSTKVGL